MTQLTLIERSALGSARESGVADQLGRRESDKIIRQVSDGLLRLEGKVDALVEDHSEVKAFVKRYVEKSEETGDPHHWIKSIGQPTARDFNKAKSMSISIGVIFVAAYGLFKLFKNEIWAKLTQ